jgi:acetyl-CoA acetyltransferase
MELFGEIAIAGHGATDFSHHSGRSELALAGEAVCRALANAGLSLGDVDGLVSYDLDDSPEISVANSLGIPALRYFSRTPHGGGGACATVLHAGMAVATGMADVVVCYRAFNERSGVRFGRGVQPTQATAAVDASWTRAFGLLTPASKMAIVARRYLHDFGGSTLDFAAVSVTMRLHASTNPKAWFYERPITVEDHQASRPIAEPLRLLDCCLESDGGVALVVTSLERARHLPGPTAVLRGGAQSSILGQEIGGSYFRPTISGLPEMRFAGEQVWQRAGLGPGDVQAAIIYDHFTPYVLMQLEELGFCGRGEAGGFVADGGIAMGGRLPVNPHGGQLGEAYLHGMNGIAEAVRQVQGTAVNQVPGLDHILVTSGAGVPTSVMVLGQDR